MQQEQTSELQSNAYTDKYLELENKSHMVARKTGDLSYGAQLII